MITIYFNQYIPLKISSLWKISNMLRSGYFFYPRLILTEVRQLQKKNAQNILSRKTNL